MFWKGVIDLFFMVIYMPNTTRLSKWLNVIVPVGVYILCILFCVCVLSIEPSQNFNKEMYKIANSTIVLLFISTVSIVVFVLALDFPKDLRMPHLTRARRFFRGLKKKIRKNEDDTTNDALAW